MLKDTEELQKVATPGPLVWKHDIIWANFVGGCQQKKGDFMFAQVRGWGHLSYNEHPEETQDANGALLAHYYTHGRDMLKALKAAVVILAEAGFEGEVVTSIRETLAKASKVEVPNA